MKLQLKVTPVFKKNYRALNEPNLRFIVNRGGSRSSKTYSILQLLIWYALNTPNATISICRKTGPALYATVYRDFVDICEDLNIMEQLEVNKTRGLFKFNNGTIVQFFSVDESQKLRGRKHSVVYINEANEINAEEFLQLNLRTSDKIILDFNPSDEIEWITNILKEETRSIEIHSTFKDNSFLSPQIKKEIENLINSDYTKYQIYALGLYPLGKERVFPTIFTGEFPDTDNYIYGMDFGYNDPCVITKVWVNDGTLYIKEELFESYLNTEELIERMNELKISKKHLIYADSARPDLIDSLKKAGYYITKSDKKIIEGIDLMKTFKIVITKDSNNTYKEFKHHTYKVVKDKVTDIPTDFNNHSVDATRYAVMSLKKRKNLTFHNG